jgi:hypothetical protein
MTMIGKFIQIPDSEDPDFSHDGQIQEVFGDMFLVRMRNVVEGPPHSRLFPIADLLVGFVFETEEELTAWREWDPEAPVKILPFEK